MLTPLLRAALTAATFAGLACAAVADQLISDDLIVDGRLCVGTECVNNESFGIETIRLKQNDNRIEVEDTSTATHPSDDWRLTFNDSNTINSGGRDNFQIENLTQNRTPFKIAGDAPNNAMFIGDNGHLGLGTGLPQKDLHIINGDAPAIRLEQDTSVGFTRQVWDLATNEFNFFIRDVTNSGNLPLRVSVGAPTNSLFVAGDGDVGIGTDDPTAPLHVIRTAATNADIFRLQNNGPTVMRLIDDSTGVTWTFQNQAGTFRVATPLVPGPEMMLEENGDMTISGELTTAGSCSAGCDRVFDQNYNLRPLAEHAALMWENRHLPAVGPTSEDGPINISQKIGGMLNELELAHIYIEQLHKQVSIQKALIATYEARLDSYEARMKAVEER